MKQFLLKRLLTPEELDLLGSLRVTGREAEVQLNEDDFASLAHFLGTTTGRRLDAAMRTLVAGKASAAVWGNAGDEVRANAAARGFASCWGTVRGLAQRASAKADDISGEDGQA
jgi:hypothetical protein